MPEESQSSPPPSDRRSGRSADPASSDELDSLLAEAAALAADVSSELGGNDADRPDEAVNIPLESVDRETTEDVDARLEDLDALVGAAVNEVGSNAGPPAAPPTGAAPPVPSFMDEFTRPEEPVAPPASPVDHETTTTANTIGTGRAAGRDTALTPTTPESNVAPPAVPSFMDEFTRPDKPAENAPPAAVGKPAPAAPRPAAAFMASSTSLPNPARPQPIPSPAPTAGTIAVAEHPEGAEQVDPLDEIPREEPTEQVPDTPIMATCWRAGSRLADLLEVLDRPLHGIGQRIRTVVAWLAVALLVAAFVVFVLSLR